MLVVSQHGTVIGKKEESLSIKVMAKLKEVSIRHVEGVLVMGQAQITHDAMVLLAQHAIPVVWMNRQEPIGIYMPFASHGFVETRRAQFGAYNTGKGLELVAAMVTGAMINKARLLKSYARNRRRQNPTLADDIQQQALNIEQLTEQLLAVVQECRQRYQNPGSSIRRVRSTPRPEVADEAENEPHSQPIIEPNLPESQQQTQDPEIATDEDISELPEEQEIILEQNEPTHQVENPTPATENEFDDEIPPGGSENDPEENDSPTSIPTSSNLNESMEVTPLNRYRQRILMLEGRAAQIYFDTLGRVFMPELNFRGRNRRPPRDPINAALSFGYHLLAKEIMAAISVAGLEPYAGFLHTDRSGRASLVFDMIEEFRQPMVDRLVLRMFQQRTLQPQDFEGMGRQLRASPQTASATENGPENNGEAETVLTESTGWAGVRFTQAGIEKFIGEFYYLLRKEGFNIRGSWLTMEKVILQQARRAVRFLLGKDARYEPFTMTW
jgi:CRISPR/Cas system-associated endonuclease Cas1